MRPVTSASTPARSACASSRRPSTRTAPRPITCCPGTDITFFDWPAAPERRGTHSISRTALRVAGENSVNWWSERLSAGGYAKSNVALLDGRASFDVEDPEGQRLRFVDDDSAGEAHAWSGSPVPAEHQIRGLGPITISVPDLGPTEAVLTQIMNMRR